MVDKNLILDFRNEIKDKFKYKLTLLEDKTIEVTFKVKSVDEWNEIKGVCEYFWHSYEHNCYFNEDYYSVIVDEAKSNLTNLIREQRIPNKKRYIKILSIFMAIALLISIVLTLVIILQSSMQFDVETDIMLGISVFLIFGGITYLIITFIFLNNDYRKNLFNMIIGSTFMDILLIISVHHFSIGKIFINDSFADSAINIMLLILYTFMVSLLLSLVSYNVRVYILKHKDELKNYNRLKNKGYNVRKDSIKKYCEEADIKLTDVFLSKDGTNDFFGNLGVSINLLTLEEFVKPLYMIFFTLFVFAYYWTVISYLSIFMQIVMVVYILLKTTLSTITGINKDKLILVNATFHMEKLVNLEQD